MLIGIPKTAKNVAGAVKFIQWFANSQNQATWAGLQGANDVVNTFPLPARLSSFNLMINAGDIAQASQLATILKGEAQIAAFPVKDQNVPIDPLTWFRGGFMISVDED